MLSVCFLVENRVSSCYPAKGLCERVGTDRLRTYCLLLCPFVSVVNTDCVKAIIGHTIGHFLSFLSFLRAL